MTSSGGQSTATSLHLPVPVGLEEAILLAVARHQNGRLDEAEQIYEAVLVVAPDHPDALHFMGVLKHQRARARRRST